MISAAIIAKNASDVIVNIIDQLSFADEIIVIDNGSSDGTFQEAKKKNAHVYTVKGTDFSELRNSAAKYATKDWILYVDTDEQLTEEIKEEIVTITRNKPAESEPQAYVIKRINYYLGYKWPTEDGMIRLIYKPSLKKWYGELHETADIAGIVSELKYKLMHHTHRTLEEMVDKTNIWSNTEAQLRFNSHHPTIVPWRLLRVFLTGFMQSYIKQFGWKAGVVGIIESMYQGFSMFITYAKLWEMQRNVYKKSLSL